MVGLNDDLQLGNLNIIHNDFIEPQGNVDPDIIICNGYSSNNSTDGKDEDQDKILHEQISFVDSGHSHLNKELLQMSQNPNIIKEIVSAAQRGNIEVLKYYLTKSSKNPNPLSPNITDTDGITLVHWAALNNKLSTIKFLVSIGADPDVPAGDMMATPLLWAVRYGLVYVSDWLIRETNANVNIVDKTGIGIFLASVFSSNVMMIIYVIWTLNKKENHKLNNQIVGFNGINTFDPHKRTALHWAAYQGDFLTVKLLIDAGANVDLVDSDGFTPLHWGLVSNNKSVIQLLVKANCDVSKKTLDGKTAWDIASDMKISNMWKAILKENNRNALNGEKYSKFLKENWTNFIVFFFPFLTLPLTLWCFSINESIYSKAILLLCLFVGQQIFIKEIILPSYMKEQVTLTRTPFFAGIFASSAFMCIATWIFKIIPVTIKNSNLLNLVFLSGSICSIYFFLKSMLMNPGYIPKETNEDKVCQTIYELIKLRKYDSNNFCINSYVRKPLRSKFSREIGLNIARFDHYCPWVNNNVGVRNHKIFFAFTLFLELSIICWIILTLQYFNTIKNKNEVLACTYLSQSLCAGFTGSKFMFCLLAWTIIQMSWLSTLLLVQIVQISKGCTTYEISHSHSQNNGDVINDFSSIPTDDNIGKIAEKTEENSNLKIQGEIDTEVISDNNFDSGTEDIEANISKSIVPSASHHNKFKKIMIVPLKLITRILTSRCSRMVGLDQTILITNDLINNRKINNFEDQFNFGVKRNWMDFLFLCRNGDCCSFRTLVSIPIAGENNLDGKLVDYYKLYENPIY